MAQVPAAQYGVALARLHTVPHAPQLVALPVMLVSQPLAMLPSQFDQPPVQVHAHELLAQVRVVCGYVAQITPQPEQLFGSEARFTQLPVAAQYVVPAGHELTQVPPEQTVPAPQTLPHAPQLLFVLSARSQPFDTVPSQLPQPALQLAMPQVPPPQFDVALAREQVVPQPPQFVTEVLRFTSQPFDVVPSQLP